MTDHQSLQPDHRDNNGVNVLMSTHHGETAIHLAEALESLYSQSLTPDRIVLVEDGPIGQDQRDVITTYSYDRRGPQLTRVVLPENRGLARALNSGLVYCDGDYIMRMDSDDVSMPDRLELQLAYLRAHPEIDIVSSWADEFSNVETVKRLKVSPTEHDALAMALRWRNVIAHSAILMKTSVLSKVNGYRSDFGLLEDYDLWVRMVMNGARFHVLPKVLLSIRTSLGQSSRRGNWTYLKSEFRFRTECLRIGFLTRSQYCATLLLYAAFRIASPVLRQRIYALARTPEN